MTCSLIDIWEMLRDPDGGRNYTGFDPPTIQDLKRIVTGNIIKISCDINKLFIEITENNPCDFSLTGKIVLGNTENTPYKIGDTLTFLYRNVYSISEDLRCI
jgi:hypothetical protein